MILVRRYEYKFITIKDADFSVTDKFYIFFHSPFFQDFFADLEGHRTLLDTMAESLDQPTRDKYKSKHTHLNNTTRVVQDKASIQGQKLQQLVQQWYSFNQQFDDSEAWVSRLERQLPEEAQEDDDLDELRSKIWDYHTIQRALADEKATLYQVGDKGRHLLQNLKCAPLETKVNKFSENWVQISNSTDNSLKR